MAGQALWMIPVFVALLILGYFLAFCCSFDRREKAIKHMVLLIYFSHAGLAVLSLTALILTFDSDGASCRGHEDDHPLSLEPIKYKYGPQEGEPI
eukprot:CAMPEP_0170463962 /NCGR_PEP_ID=MMETSP0123-20130129/8870_1 /TAXON_ID=182087 /ORGANISM="Favella ehrenbergii, Strain Fehren 1" /LENGTH=94 /DNA_ID=CAMNT_0010729511 /DNA_START=190 /DNA_END=474 /DNA_ORIENTATION=-